jgi:hypothetical protein
MLSVGINAGGRSHTLVAPRHTVKYPEKNASSCRNLLEAQRREADAVKMLKRRLYDIVHTGKCKGSSKS